MRKLIPLLLMATSIFARAQVGGKHSFDFLNIPNSARLAALGGVNVSLADKDVSLFVSNPALAGDTLNGEAIASYQVYVADIGQAFFGYAHHFDKIGKVLMGIRHVGYGDITGYDASGIETGTFNSGETALVIGKNHRVSNFRLGANLKGVFSDIAGYRSGAVMLDLGGVFIHPDKEMTVGLAIQNLGFVISDYTETNHRALPFDVQAGITFKPEHMPLRFSFTAFNLRQPDVTYYDPQYNDEKPGTVKKILSHLNMGTEILIHKNVTIMAGYNYLVHQALVLTGGGGGAGLSLGFSAAVKSLEFVFSRSGYVAGNAGYSFTLSTNIDKLLKRQ